MQNISGNGGGLVRSQSGTRPGWYGETATVYHAPRWRRFPPAVAKGHTWIRRTARRTRRGGI